MVGAIDACRWVSPALQFSVIFWVQVMWAEYWLFERAK
jgi:hypothetical protein